MKGQHEKETLEQAKLLRQNALLAAYKKAGVPVFDVRTDRKRVSNFIKNSNKAKGSKFFKPSYSEIGYSYNIDRETAAISWNHLRK